MQIVVLNEADIKKVFTMEDAIKADKDALAIYSNKESVIPLRINIDIPDHKGQSLFMPGYASGANALGIKIVSVYPDNIQKGLPSLPATMIMENEDTGEVCSILDGTCLTRIRTGAVSGAATDLLAKKDAQIFALIGTGGQAEAQLEAVLTIRSISEVRIYDNSKERAAAFVNKMEMEFAGKFSARFVQFFTPDEAVSGADIITCVTTSKRPVFNGRLLKKGAHINGIGSYTPDMQEIDEYVLINADKIYVDTRDGVLNESGDFIIPMKENKISLENITGELGEVILGKIPGRENDEEITLFKSVGSGILDIVTARRIYEKADEMGIGQIIKF